MTVVSQMLAQGVEMSLEEADELLTLYGNGRPEIAKNYHNMIKATIKQGKPLITPFGRVRHFYGMHNNATFREAYSFIPQSMVPYITNFVWKHIEETDLCITRKAEVLYMGHDSLVTQVDEEYVDEFKKVFLEISKEISFDIGEHRGIIMPWDFGTGKNLGEISDD